MVNMTSTSFNGELIFGSFTKDGAVYYLVPEETEIHFDKEFLGYEWLYGLEQFKELNV